MIEPCAIQPYVLTLVNVRVDMKHIESNCIAAIEKSCVQHHNQNVGDLADIMKSSVTVALKGFHGLPACFLPS